MSYYFWCIKLITMKNFNQIADLKKQLELLYLEMPQTFFDQQQRDKSVFLITKEIEKLENPLSYSQNSNHWDNHEIRL